jgi:hypothetical protein
MAINLSFAEKSGETLTDNYRLIFSAVLTEPADKMKGFGDRDS